MPKNEKTISFKSGGLLNKEKSSIGLGALKDLSSKVSYQFIDWPIARDMGVSVEIRRDDLIDPVIGGNKLYKLHGHLDALNEVVLNEHASNSRIFEKQRPLASFGGAYSNHLYALAGLGSQLNLETIGIIRGEQPKRESATLKDLREFGMQLKFVSRNHYAELKTLCGLNSSSSGTMALGFPDETFFIPEGGGGSAGIKGCKELGRSLVKKGPTVVGMASGTGTTMAGVLLGMAEQIKDGGGNRPKVMAISALKSSSSTVRSILDLIEGNKVPDWMFSNQFHCGGFAKITTELQTFMDMMREDYSVPLDRVYTAKLVYGFYSLIKAGNFRAGTKIVLLHSGGLQGNRN
ncbi:MAG: 1-aminocyclopropane-1-carboxylate deaminase [Flavobacteriales bacterium]|jgi:1-aminocyclopropane-1-carboxylate deaminase